MSERTIYDVQQGETHRVRIASPLASTFTATATATLHRLPGGINSYVPATATSETYAVSSFAGDATYGPGFDFELTAAALRCRCGVVWTYPRRWMPPARPLHRLTLHEVIHPRLHRQRRAQLLSRAALAIKAHPVRPSPSHPACRIL